MEMKSFLLNPPDSNIIRAPFDCKLVKASGNYKSITMELESSRSNLEITLKISLDGRGPEPTRVPKNKHDLYKKYTRGDSILSRVMSRDYYTQTVTLTIPDSPRIVNVEFLKPPSDAIGVGTSLLIVNMISDEEAAEEGRPVNYHQLFSNDGFKDVWLPEIPRVLGATRAT